MEVFSTPVFKVLIWIFVATAKICTKGCFTLAYTTSCTTTFAPSYLLAPNTCDSGGVSVLHFSTIHFQGLCIWQVSCSTLFSRLSSHPVMVTLLFMLCWKHFVASMTEAVSILWNFGLKKQKPQWAQNLLPDIVWKWLCWNIELWHFHFLTIGSKSTENVTYFLTFWSWKISVKIDSIFDQSYCTKKFSLCSCFWVVIQTKTDIVGWVLGTRCKKNDAFYYSYYLEIVW